MAEQLCVALVGNYPSGTLEQFQELFKQEPIRFCTAETAEQYAALTDADCIIMRGYPITEDDMARNPSLKLICRWGTGYDSVNIEAAGKCGIAVCNTPGANACAVSEHTAALMLALLHNIVQHTYSLRAGIWSKNLYADRTFTLKDRLVGIVGGGNIGRRVAHEVQSFGAEVQYYDVFRLSEEMEQKCQMKYVPLEELLRTSDLVSLHVPLTAENHHMIAKPQFDMMKRGAYLINTARGGLVNEKDLIDAVQSGQLSGAGIDCLETEPFEPDDPILKCPNIIVTPHVGGTSADIGNAIIPMLVENLHNLLDNKPYSYVVNKSFLIGRPA